MESNTTIDEQHQVAHAPNTLEARVVHIDNELRAVRDLCRISNMAGGVIDRSVEPAKTLLLRFQSFILWLENNAETSPALTLRNKMDQAIQLIQNNPQFHFQEETRDRARSLYERWQAQNGGRVVEESSDYANSDDDAASGSASRATEKKKADPTVRLPPVDHPIFGIDGIMYGVALQIGAHRNDYVIGYPKRNAKVYGHNGLEVGDWWPTQLVALFHGAHGARTCGIAGNRKTGAHSVVIAGGSYEDLDQDEGDVLFYAGSSSHNDTDPKEPFPTRKATLALKTSQRLGKPVRVLRAAGSRSSKSKVATLRPTVGIRYDGLYRVVGMLLKTNAKGGLYEQFKMERLGGQRPLNDFVKSRPTAKEVRDFNKIEDGF
jgi:hypothetical protein